MQIKDVMQDEAVREIPVGRDDLVAWLAAGCKPQSRWRIGTEHEKFGFRLKDLTPISYEGVDGIRTLFLALADGFGWEPVMEGDNPIALVQGEASITLEPGGQIELSGAPLATIHQTHGEINDHLHQLGAVCRDLGVAFLGVGTQPKWSLADTPRVPKRRYGVMSAYLPGRGRHALDMMHRTATVQANLDFASEADMRNKFRLALALQPLVTALFASSPFFDGRPTGFLSFRSEIWRHTDPDRCGLLPFVFEKGFGFERYADYAIAAPMFFVVRNKHYIPAHGQPFADFLAGRLRALPGEYPTLDDWQTHLTTLFPDVRMKQFLEMRGADAGNSAHLCALPALWKGLLYDGNAMRAAWDLVADWTLEQRLAIHGDVPRLGLATPTPEGSMRQLGHRVLEIAQEGLARFKARNADGCDETLYLRPVREVLESGLTAAERMLAAYETRWGGSVDPLFKEMEFESFLAECRP